MAPRTDPDGALLRELSELELLELEAVASDLFERLEESNSHAARYVRIVWLAPVAARRAVVGELLEAARIDLEANGHELTLGSDPSGDVAVGTRAWCSCGWASDEVAPDRQDEAVHRELGETHRVDHDGAWKRG